MSAAQQRGFAKGETAAFDRWLLEGGVLWNIKRI
jgi:hypothetical protein